MQLTQKTGNDLCSWTDTANVSANHKKTGSQKRVNRFF